MTAKPYSADDVESVVCEIRDSLAGGFSFAETARAVLDALTAAGWRRIEDDPRHIIEVRDEGWCIQHPLACRVGGGLSDCPVNLAAKQLDDAPAPAGRYDCSIDDSGRLLVGSPIATQGA